MTSMNKFLYLIIFAFICISSASYAGNPDRQGEAGAVELLMNPWARSAGLHTMSTSFISGVEAMRLNIAGLARINKTEIQIGHTRYLEGVDISFNALGFAQKIGKNGCLGVSIMALDIGDIPVTLEGQPQGNGSTYSPGFFNLGVGYAHQFENKISVGFLFRIISETAANVSATGFAVDAGVQYVTGPQDNFKLGISLRNVGSPMSFSGEALSQRLNAPGRDFQHTYSERTSGFELPSVLNLGVSYDFIIKTKYRITALGNFTSNSFSRDQIGGGLEFSLNDMFILRGAYKYEIGASEDVVDNALYTGLAGGVTLQAPVKKGSKTRFAIDYAYRVSSPFSGSHNIGIRFNL